MCDPPITRERENKRALLSLIGLKIIKRGITRIIPVFDWTFITSNRRARSLIVHEYSLLFPASQKIKKNNLFAPGAIKIIMFEIQKFKDSKDPKIFEDAHLRGLMVASDDFGKFAKF